MGDRWGPSVLTGQSISRTQVIIWCDVVPSRRVVRIIWRSSRYAGRNRPEHPPDNRDWQGLRQFCFIRKAWGRSAVFEQSIAESVAKAVGPVIRLRNAADVPKLLASHR